MRLLILGATGAVGQHLLARALADPAIDRVYAPTRRPLPQHPKLDNAIIDFRDLPEQAPWYQVDAVLCALGTTIAQAGSQMAFAEIDRDLVIAIARATRACGASRFALNSSLGASHQGNFYLRTKAQAEDGVRAIGFESLSIVRPSLIDTDRAQPRLGERIGLAAAGLFGPLIPRRYRPVPAGRIAAAMLDAVLAAEPGVQIIENEALLG